jgi:hypothetical protein
VRIVTTGWRRSDDAIGAEVLPQLRGRDCSSVLAGAATIRRAGGCYVHVARSRDWRRALLPETDVAAGAVEEGCHTRMLVRPIATAPPQKTWAERRALSGRLLLAYVYLRALRLPVFRR